MSFGRGIAKRHSKPIETCTKCGDRDQLINGLCMRCNEQQKSRKAYEKRKSQSRIAEV